jgi:glycine hydroxymethyltransferase
VLVDLRSKKITGKVAEENLESVGIVVNRNVIPNDPERPDIASGIRVGASAIAARGMAATEVVKIVELMDRVMVNRPDNKLLLDTSADVLQLCKRFPVYK